MTPDLDALTTIESLEDYLNFADSTLAVSKMV